MFETKFKKIIETCGDLLSQCRLSIQICAVVMWREIEGCRPN